MDNRDKQAVLAGERAAETADKMTHKLVDEMDSSDLQGIIPLALMHPRLQELARQHYPKCLQSGSISIGEFEHLHHHWLHEVFEKEHKRIEGVSTDPDDLKHPDLPDINTDFGYKPTHGEMIADKVAKFGGSWMFIGIFAAFLVLWMATNIVIFRNHGWDPYPFILLNLCLSCLAAIQAPVIMMSQNRQEQRDHLRSEYDFQINLRAEIALRSLHHKFDRMLSHQWERIEELRVNELELHEQVAKLNGKQQG